MSKMLFTACSQSYDFKLQRSSSIVRFEVKNIFLDFEKRSSLLGMYNAGDVVVFRIAVYESSSPKKQHYHITI
jgi:hypothetical protein